jgi:hypothetical protein
VDGVSFDSISDSNASWLERAFEEEEVKKVLSAMNGDKAPGPDGFSMAFSQACWDVVRVDIMKVFDEFHARGLFEKSLNASFISLIQKVPGANSIKDFRPIRSFPNLRALLSKGGRFLIRFLLLMNALIVGLDQGCQASFAKWTWRKHTIMLTGIFFCIC